MKTIFKYQVDFGPCEIKLPVNAQFRLFGQQDDKLMYVWFFVDLDAPREKRNFIIRGTGSSIPNNEFWLGSAQAGSFVWHLHEVK